MLSKLLQWMQPEPAPVSVVPKSPSKLPLVRARAQQGRLTVSVERYAHVAPGVVPEGSEAAMAMDDNLTAFPSEYYAGYQDYAGFMGYPRLSMLATRAEYRAMASALATELTREWITITCSKTDDEGAKQKVTELTQKIEDIGLQQVIQRAAEHDALFGRAQIFIDIKGAKRDLPLILSPKTIARDSFIKVTTVEAMWTTPSAYNANDPAAPDFYKPTKWYMLGQQVHASRLLTVITRPLPDMLKAAFNFGGMSLSQLAQPYVDNWLRTRQSVADLINNFSITALKTSMDQVLDGSDDGTDLFDRADFFTATRSNRGLMLLDKDREELEQVNTPLSGLHELQGQALELLCFVSRQPATILTGIEPSGLNASSEGSMVAWYDWIAAQQEAYWWMPIDTIFKVLQLSMYGEIDPDITFSFVGLSQPTPKELSEIRAADATAAQTYVAMGAIDGEEVREKLARDPESGYQGLDLSKVIEAPNVNDEEENNADENEQSS